MNEPSNDELLAILRDLQDSQRARGPTSFNEWTQEQARIEKAAGGRVQFGGTLGGGYNPGVGMLGRGPGYTSSRTGGPVNTNSGYNAVGLKRNPQFMGVPTGQTIDNGPSKYLDPVAQPAPWIDDVDMSSIWYSPMEPVWPFGPPYYNYPREWNYNVGYNLNFIPNRIATYGVLRSMRQQWGVLATIEATRMDQLLRIPWTIQRKDKPRMSSKGVEDLRKFFRRPDGKNTFSQWSRKLLFDLFDIDAPTIFVDRSPLGKCRHVDVMDGAMFFPLIDDMGRRPDSDYTVSPDGIRYTRRQPAFQQIVYGLPMLNFSEDQILYPIMRPRPELPMFGYSPVEQIYIETMEAIRKTLYQLEFWRSGSMPELIVTVPDSWTPKHIATFQAHFDALLSGNLSLKSKVRFVPGGMKPFDIKNASGESLWSQRDEMLIRLACYAFSVSPTPFIHQNNRATAQSAQQSAQEEGLYPLMSWFKDDIMDTIIQEVLGYDDIEFVYLPRPEVDMKKQAEIHKIQLDEGIRTRNEVREELGQEPFEDGGDVPTITTGAGVIPLSMAVTGQQFAIGSAPLPGTGPSEPAEPANGPKPKKPKGEPRNQNPAQNRPQRGAPRPHEEPAGKPTSIHKVDDSELDAAQRNAKGHLPDYSHVQLHVGNYPKGHVWIDGLNVSIENAKGSLRGEKDEKGVKWQVKMPAAYGYIRGTIGADNEAMDVYIGRDASSKKVFVVDQNKVSKKGKIKGFDEHKVFLCYKNYKKALKDYLASHFDNHGEQRLEVMVELSISDFKDWLKNGKLKKPIADQDVGTVVLKQKDLEKSDTISMSTNLAGYSYLNAGRPKKKKRKAGRMGSRWQEFGVPK